MWLKYFTSLKENTQFIIFKSKKAKSSIQGYIYRNSDFIFFIMKSFVQNELITSTLNLSFIFILDV